jgi:hypothetical protein
MATAFPAVVADTRRAMARWLRLVIALAIVVWLVATLASRWQGLSFPEWSASPAEVAVAFGAGALAIVGLALLFVVELHVLGLARTGHAAFYVRMWFQSYFYRYVPGKVMLFAERVRLGESVGIPRATSAVVVVWETVLLLGGAGVLAPLGLAYGNDQSIVFGSVVCIAALLTFLLAVRIAARSSATLDETLGPLVRGVPLRVQAGLVGGYALVWLLFGISFAATCRWFVSGEAAGLGAALWFVSAYVAGLATALLPAGIGVREAVLVVGLSRWVPADDALAMALASRIAMTSIELTLVALSRLLAVPRDLYVDG